MATSEAKATARRKGRLRYVYKGGVKGERAEVLTCEYGRWGVSAGRCVGCVDRITQSDISSCVKNVCGSRKMRGFVQSIQHSEEVLMSTSNWWVFGSVV